MDGHTFLSWNIPNLITVVLMGAVGFFVVGAAIKLYNQRMGGGS
jgi:hypothetical protein